eukprot:3219201-Karenia_brevis.AAC.1
MSANRMTSLSPGRPLHGKAIACAFFLNFSESLGLLALALSNGGHVRTNAFPSLCVTGSE